MRFKLKILLALMFMLGPPLLAQNQTTAILTAANSSCIATSCISVAGNSGTGSATIYISANTSGNTVQFEDLNGNSITSVQNSTSSSTQYSSATGTGTFQFSIGAYSGVRARISTLVSGSTTVTVTTSTASAHAGGGGTGGGVPAFPVTVTGGVSGAVPCFTSTTTESAGTLLAANTLVLGGGTGACPTTNGAWIEDVGNGNSLRSNINGGIILTPSGTNGSGATIFLSTNAAESMMQLANSAGGGSFNVDASANMSTNGSVTFTGVTTGTNADFACFAAGKVLTLQSSACTISSVRFKQNIHLLSASALREVMKLKPVTFNRIPDQVHPDSDVNAYLKQIGLTAENVASIDPKAAIYEQDGVTPKSYRQESVIALLVKAMQEQQKEIAELQEEVKQFGGIRVTSLR